MRRALTIFLIFASLGAMLNVAGVFACAYWSQPREFDPQLMAKIRREFFSRDGTQSGRAYWPMIAYKGFGAQFIDIAIDEPNLIENSISGSYPCLGVIRAGWPWMAMEAELWHDATQAPTVKPAEFRWAIPIAKKYASADRLFLERMLPLRPMWPGFVLNTLVLALLLWLMWFAAMSTRRAIRIRRGQCPWCAYPMGVSERCSECGREPGRRPAKLSP
jgi:hypothetical protein